MKVYCLLSWNNNWNYSQRTSHTGEKRGVSCGFNLSIIYFARVISNTAISLWNVNNDSISVCGVSLRWRHNGCDSVSNHQPRECLLRRLIRRTSKKRSKLRVTGLCVGNSPGTGEFPAQMASYAENASIWWRHHDSCIIKVNVDTVSHGLFFGLFWFVVKWISRYYNRGI